MSDWTTADYALLMSALASNHADAETTRSLIAGGGVEYNPLLGRNPSKQRIDNLELGTHLGVLALGALAPKNERRIALAAITGMKGALAYQNRKGRQHDGFAAAMKKPVAIGLTAALLAHYGLQDEEKQLISLVMDEHPKLQFTMKF